MELDPETVQGNPQHTGGGGGGRMSAFMASRPIVRGFHRCRALCTMSLSDRTSLAGRRALITGGNRGLGLEISIGLLQAGAEIGVASRARPADEAMRRLNDAGSWHFVEADIGTAEGAARTADDALSTLKEIDILVNNAGVALLDKLDTLSVDAWDRTMAINLRAPFILSQRLVRGMVARRRGKIINISSVAGVDALDLHGAYSVSKAGVNMLTKMMTVEWAKYNIQANAIAPTVIMTDMGKQVWGTPEKGDPMRAKIPLGRFGEPVEVADAVVFLASSASDLICGQTLCLDGGFTTQ